MINVLNDTGLLPRGCPVRSMKKTLGMKVPAQKDSDGKFYYLNCKPVDRYTRSGYSGREIICPMCDHVSTVYHFSWSAINCQHCDTMIDKRHWWTIK